MDTESLDERTLVQDESLSETTPTGQTSDYLYLKQLQFRPELRKSFLNFFVTNFRVVILLILLLTIVGVYAFATLPRESNPEVKIPIAVVAITYPGASPADIEELITKKVETGIAGLKDIKKITSNSANSIATLTVEYDAKADLDASLRKLRDQVTSLQKDLPTEAGEPIVKEVSLDDTPVMTLSVSGSVDGFTLRQYADDMKDELEKIPGVREVIVSGGDQREFEIAYDPQKLTLYSVSVDQANQIVKAANIAFPAGTFEGQKYSFPVRSDGRFFDAEALASLPILHTEEGAVVTLRDIATVSEKAIEKTVYSRLSSKGGQPQNDVNLSIIKKTGGSIITTTDEAMHRMDELIAKHAGVLRYDVVTNIADTIRKNFDQLTHDFLLTIILVFSILFLIVGLKEAIVAGLAVPLVFFATFGSMLATGISLNFLSVFSLILALGLLVDDAIVVVSATKQYLRSGKFTPEEAVLLVLSDFKVVLLTTTLTTVWAFLPLLMSTGIMGEFIKSIPITVSVTLISSLIIALIINHPLAAVLERVRLTPKKLLTMIALFVAVAAYGFTIVDQVTRIAVIGVPALVVAILIVWYMRGGRDLLRNNKVLVEQEWRDDELIKKKLREQGSHLDEGFFSKLIHGIIRFDRILPIYERILRRLMRTRTSRAVVVILVAIAFVGAVSLPVLGIVKSEFFPSADSDLIFINITAPAGLKLDETSAIAANVESRLLKYKEILNFSTIVGRPVQGRSFSQSFGTPSNEAGITIRLVDGKKRSVKSYELVDVIRNDVKDIKDATIAVSTQTGGPPSGADFEAQVRGEDLQKLDSIANELKPILTSIPGVVDPDISLKDSPAEYTFKLDPTRLELYNLNAVYVGSILRTAISGTEVSTVIRGGKEIKIIARFDKEKIPDLQAIQNLQILNLRKQPVFLKDVATIELVPSVDAITRINQKRTVLLSASVRGKTNPQQVVAAFQQKISQDYKLPEGYEIVYGGENEQNQESVQSILRAMILAGLLIVSTLVIQFNSFKKALIILVTIPLALIGVFVGLALTGINLSFPGLIGILALFGIVVKNAIILMDKINLNIRHQIPYEEAIIDAGKSRLEAIFITSICTIFGIIPITLSNETWTALGGSVIFGLMLSSFLTLFMVPILFRILVRDGERF